MKVALAHDYLTQFGGAERLTLTLTKIFEGAKLYTSVYNPTGTYEDFRNVNVVTTFIQGMPLAQIDPRLAILAMPAAWKALRVDKDVDVAICSSTGWSHALRVPDGCRKIVYCHNPARWLYQTAEYIGGRGAQMAFGPIRGRLESWDKRMAGTADAYVVNSLQVADRVWRAYGVNAQILHPPVMIDAEGQRDEVEGVDRGYWLVVARGRSYKNIRAIVEAFATMPNERLVIVGNGGSKITSKNVRELGIVGDGQLRWLYANARALVSVSVEDFGLTPLEANTFGTPVAVLRAGGYIESTAEGTSGIFIDTPSAGSIKATIRSFPEFSRSAVRAHATQFSVERFSARVGDIIRG